MQTKLIEYNHHDLTNEEDYRRRAADVLEKLTSSGRKSIVISVGFDIFAPDLFTFQKNVLIS
jgi:hypothetical protein